MKNRIFIEGGEIQKMLNLSIVTATYNRAKLLPNLYESIIINKEKDIQIQWLIIDDGSTDQTLALVKKWQQEEKIKIDYYFQENQGKMKALNEVIDKAEGDLIIECDSDDYFMPEAFKKIKKEYENNQEKNIYAICFLKYNTKGQNMGNEFKNRITTMFDLYFKEAEDGEKCLVFYADVRKKYKYELERQEKFVTEARMHHKMDLQNSIVCSNEPIMICEYQEDGYTKNIKKQLQENPYGYYEYFKEIFEQDMKGVPFAKRLYVVKHFILFTYLTKTKHSFKNVKGFFNKLLYIGLWIPGTIKSKICY